MKCYNFYCKHINKQDYKTLLKFAKEIRNEKNKISKIVFENYLYDMFFHKISQYDFLKLMKYYRTINDATAYQQLCKQVYTTYNILLNNLQYKYNNNLSKEENKVYKFLFKFHFSNKNDLIKYLSRNKNKFKDIVDENLINRLKTTNLFNDIQNLQMIELNKLKVVEFKSLTFNTNNVLNVSQTMITLKHSRNYNALINLKIAHQKLLCLYTKYNKQYHKNLNDFSHSTRYKYKNKVKTSDINQSIYNYSIKFLNNYKIKVIMFKDIEDNDIFEEINKDNTIGVDVNVKHNMFAISRGNDQEDIFINIDKKLICKERNLQRYLARIQHNKDKNHNSKKHGKKVKNRENKQERRRIFHQNKKSRELIDYCNDHNIKNIMMEDINLQTKGCKDKEGNNHKHIEQAIHINDLKNSVQRIGNKNGIQVHLVNPRYTSQVCHICGNIDKNNRKSQETFTCTCCEHTANADSHSALNILERGINETLRKKLEYCDKKEKRYKGKLYQKTKVYIDVYQKYISNKQQVLYGKECA